MGTPVLRGSVREVPGMTDEFVKAAKGADGMDERHVLCEKWW